MTLYDLIWFTPWIACVGAAVVVAMAPGNTAPWLERFGAWSAAGIGAFIVVAPVTIIAFIMTASVPVSVAASLIAMHFGGEFVTKATESDLSRKAEAARKSQLERKARQETKP